MISISETVVSEYYAFSIDPRVLGAGKPVQDSDPPLRVPTDDFDRTHRIE